MLVIYGLYKIFTFWMARKNEVQFGLGSIIAFTFLHLFVVCTIYADMPEGQQMALPLGLSSGPVLFFHILSLLVYPVILVLIARASGYSLLSRTIPSWSTRDLRVTILAETTL